MFLSAPQLSTISLFGQIGGGLLSAYSSYQGAKSQQQNLMYQADAYSTQARIAELSAQSALQAGNQKISAIGMRAGQIRSKQIAAQAANGIDLNSASAKEVRVSSDIMAEIDKNTANVNAVRSAWGYRTQGASDMTAAMNATNAAGSINPWMAGATSLLGSATQVASSWYKLSGSGYGMNLGTAWNSGTTPFSEQTQLLADQWS